VAARIELAGGDHLIVDPARTERTLDQSDHLLLCHRELPSDQAANSKRRPSQECSRRP
jgi:hypothetical protein